MQLIDSVDGVPAGEQVVASPGANRSAISLHAVRKVFPGRSGDVVALHGVDLDVSSNEFFTLLGPSGCGKTTLLRMIAGFEEPTSGRIELSGENVTGRPPHHRHVNTVFQNYALFPHMTIGQNIAFGLRMRGVPSDTIRTRVAEMLELVQLPDMADRVPDQLSGGQQQRVALARALANEPSVLLLDEPLSALDFKLRRGMRLELKRLQRETGITFVFVTHDQQEALEMSDRVAVMSEGRVQQIGAPDEIYEHPRNRFVADFIGETNFLAIEQAIRDGDLVRCRLRKGHHLQVAGENWIDEVNEPVLAVRPEATIVVPAIEVDDSTGTLAGEVVERVYQGTTVAYHVRIGTDDVVVARPSIRDEQALDFAVGEAVGVHVPPKAARIIAA
jgi:spermidine/putrescine transport system ATP-binding protein